MNLKYKEILKKHSEYRRRAEIIYLWPTGHPSWEFKYLSTSLLSDVWQTWCSFCRSVVMLSCSGGKTRNGTNIPPRSGLNSWQRISYEANQALRGHAVHSSKVINFLRHEPTWGDQTVLLRAIPALSPHNLTSLITGFGLSLKGPKHLQALRNACFHTNFESMKEARRLTTFYRGTGLSHPTDIMWWIEPSSGADAIFSWLEDLEIIADQVTK